MSLKYLYFTVLVPIICISFTFEIVLGLRYPVKYDKLGKTGISPPLAAITIWFKKVPAKINNDPIKALTYSLYQNIGIKNKYIYILLNQGAHFTTS